MTVFNCFNYWEIELFCFNFTILLNVSKQVGKHKKCEKISKSKKVSKTVSKPVQMQNGKIVDFLHR